ncbi:MAG TPA: hypothetical protein VM369_06755 [Candidatus Binatia bacterium]|nr:hypothetical protein [Candidatus Binatia bacterium]
MKHTLAVLFLLGISAAASAADIRGDLYGDFRMSLMQFDDNATAASDLDLGDNGSAYGIKLSVTERGLTAFGKYERALDTDDGLNAATGFGTSTTGLATGGTDYVREAYAGLKCPGLGTLLFGQAETAYSSASHRWDPFYNTGLAGIGGLVGSTSIVGVGPSHGGSVLAVPVRTLGYINNTVAYTSPSFGGFSVNGALYLDEDGGGAEDHDTAIGGEFNGMGLTVGLQALDLNSGSSPGSAAPNFALSSVQARLAYAGFSTGLFGVGATYERLEGSGLGSTADSLHLTGWFGLTPNARVAASFGDTNNVAEGRSLGLGLFYDVVQNFTAYLGGRTFDGKGSGGGDAYAVALGGTYKFDFGFTH